MQPGAGRLYLSGKLRLPACSFTLSSVRLFCTMNCARSPATLLLGVTCLAHSFCVNSTSGSAHFGQSKGTQKHCLEAD